MGQCYCKLISLVEGSKHLNRAVCYARKITVEEDRVDSLHETLINNGECFCMQTRYSGVKVLYEEVHKLMVAKYCVDHPKVFNSEIAVEIYT